MSEGLNVPDEVGWAREWENIFVKTIRDESSADVTKVLWITPRDWWSVTEYPTF
jgi:hypothetical protein